MTARLLTVMKRAYEYNTICEVFRKINDCCQEDTKKDIKIRELLIEAMSRAKEIIAELWKYKKACDKDWWEKNSKAEIAFVNELRRDINYKIGGNVDLKEIYNNKNIYQIIEEIDDICCNKTEKDRKVKEMLTITMDMAKRMNARLDDYKQKSGVK